ncbi:MAG: hypothetical protein GW775_00005, partial [Candidatus Magasanikbacteria bacterium]|nr:hypothetical protein [Candidatus Magasanikbacteria bacterium]
MKTMKKIYPRHTRIKRYKESLALSFWVLSAVSFLAVFITALSFWNTAQTATPPSIITYQGKLYDNGTAVTTTQSMKFTIYDAATAGSALYTASGTIGVPLANSITPSSGVFAIDLGGSETNTLDPTIFQNNDELYLEVIVGATTLTPRKRITSVPYAINSQYLMGYSATTTSSTTYIPVSDSLGAFTFLNTTTLATTTQSGDLTVDSGVLYVDSINNKVGVNSSTPTNEFSVNGQTYLSGTTTIERLLNVKGNTVAPTHVGSIASTTGAPLGGATEVVVQGDYAYVVSQRDDSLTIINVSDKTRPAEVGSIIDTQLNGAYDIKLSGKYAFITAQDADMVTVVDVENPASPAIISHIENGDGGISLDRPQRIVISGKYAYVTAQTSQTLSVIDISDPQNLVYKSNYTFANEPDNVEVVGNIVYAVTRYTIFDGMVLLSYSNLFSFDISDPENILFLDRVQAVTGMTDFGIKGNYLYGSSGEIFDISDPQNIQQVAGSLGFSSAYRIAVVGDYIYKTGSSRLAIFDISSSTNGFQVGVINDGDGGALLNWDYGVFISGNYAYVASGANLSNATSDALEIIDVSGTKISNAEIGNIRLGQLYVDGETILNNTLYIRGGANIGRSLLVEGDLSFGITSSTVSTTTVNFANRAYFTASSTDDTFIFNTKNDVADANTLFAIRDNNTEVFTINGQGYIGINTSSPSAELSVNGDTYITGTTTIGTNALFNNSNISFGTTSVQTNASVFIDIAASLTRGIVIRGDVGSVAEALLFQDETGSTIGSISGTGALSFLNAEHTLSTTTIAGDFSVKTSDQLTSVFTVDVNNGRIGINSSTPGSTLSINGNAYITGTTTIGGRLTVIGGPVDPMLVGSTVSAGGAITKGLSDIVVVKDYAYAALYDGSAGSQGILIYDISDKTAPVQISYVAAEQATEIEVKGNYMYVGYTAPAVAADNFEIYDISNPTNPTKLGGLDLATIGRGLDGLEVVGQYAYITETETDSITVIDVTDPTSPTTTDSLAFSGDPDGLVVEGKYAYVASALDDFSIVDISDPYDIRLVTTTDAGTSTRSMAIKGKYAYVGDIGNSGGIQIFDVSDVTNPTFVKDLNGYDFNRMYISGNYLYGVDADSLPSVTVVDISDPPNATIVASLSDLAFANGVYVDGNYLYVAGYSSSGFAGEQLNIYDIRGAIIPNAEIGTIKATNLQVTGNTEFGKSIDILGGLTVGASGLLVNGTLSLSSPSTSIAVATNTLKFSHRAEFISGSTQDYVFIFDTLTHFASSSQKIFSIRNGGDPLFSISASGNLRVAGDVYASTTVIGTPGQPGDLAERVDIAFDDNAEAGDVMCVDANSADTYRRCTTTSTHAVSGVISTNPNIIVGNGKTEKTAVMALVGRVPIKVSLENGPIQRGDLLVPSSIPGYAMKYDLTKDEGKNVVGVIGVALDTLNTTTIQTGKVMGLIRTGWVNNQSKNITQIEENLIEIAEGNGINLNQVLEKLQVKEQGGKIALINGNLDLAGGAIINIASLSGENNKWKVDEEGRFVTNIETGAGDKPLYAIQSQDTEFVLSGSGRLEDGIDRIRFETATQELIDINKPIKVSITLTQNAGGVYVTDKDFRGFTVKELNSGGSTATYDWVAIAHRRLSTQQIDLPVEPISSIDEQGQEPVVEEPVVEEPVVEEPVVEEPVVEEP